jgi:hypothetical protein
MWWRHLLVSIINESKCSTVFDPRHLTVTSYNTVQQNFSDRSDFTWYFLQGKIFLPQTCATIC